MPSWDFVIDYYKRPWAKSYLLNMLLEHGVFDCLVEHTSKGRISTLLSTHPPPVWQSIDWSGTNQIRVSRKITWIITHHMISVYQQHKNKNVMFCWFSISPSCILIIDCNRSDWARSECECLWSKQSWLVLHCYTKIRTAPKTFESF